MINDEICKLRDELNKSIIEGKDYSIIYQISTQLDDLIAKYYAENNKKRKKKPRNLFALLSIM